MYIVEAKKISKASLFKLMLIGAFIGLFLLFLLFGIAAIYGYETVSFNDKYITGVWGFIAALLMWPIFSLFFTCFGWAIITFGLWIYSFFRVLRVAFRGVKGGGA